MIHAVIGPVTIEAAAGEKSGPRRFTTVAYTGTPLIVPNYDLPIVLDIAGMAFGKDSKANLYHDRSKRVGHIDRTVKTDTSLTLSGLVSASGAAAVEFITDSDNGYPWQSSIEALPTSRLMRVEAGQQIKANGQVYTGPIYFARKSKLHGVAFVDRGADENTSVSLAASAGDRSILETEETHMEFEKWIEAMGLDAAELSEKQTALLRKKYDAEVKASAQPAAVTGQAAPATLVKAAAFDLDEVKASYARYEATIEAKVNEYAGKVEAAKHAEIKAKALTDGLALRKKALDESWAATRFEVEAVKAASAVEVELIRAERPTGPAIHSSSKDCSGEVIEAALCIHRGIKDVEKQYKPEVIEAADKHYRRIGLQQVLMIAACANGYTSRPGDRVHQGNIREVLEYAMPPRTVRASFSTISLPSIFSNLANKDIAQGYTEEDQSWKEVATIKNVSDLKQYITHRLLDNMEYEELPKGDSITHGKLGEETYTRQAKRYAKMFSLDEIDIINDDLGALDDLRNRIGRGSAKKFNKVFWTKFLDNAAFFTAGRGNYITGGTTNLGLDGVGLQAAILAFDNLRSPAADGSKKIHSGDKVGGMATILVHPPEVSFVADTLYKSTNLVGGSTAIPNANIHANKYRPVKVSWLSDSNYPGSSSTAFYLFRAKQDMAPMVVSFLDGVQMPNVQTSEAAFDRCGIDMRGVHYFGCDQAEYLAGVKSKGAA